MYAVTLTEMLHRSQPLLEQVPVVRAGAACVSVDRHFFVVTDQAVAARGW